MQIAGPSQSGKTLFIFQILQNMNGMCNDLPKHIVYAYSVWQPLYQEI